MNKRNINEQVHQPLMGGGGRCIFDETKEDRMGFIKKVYGILSVQLSFTAAFVFSVMMSEEFWMPFFANKAIDITVLVVYIITICALMCCG